MAHSGPGINGDVLAVSTSAQQFIERASHHRVVLITNAHASVAFFIGGSNVTNGNGYQLNSGDHIMIDLPPFAELYAIAAATSDLRWLAIDGFSSF